MAELFSSGQDKPVEAPVQQSGDVAPANNGDGQDKPQDRTFSAAEVDQIVKDRLARESKKFQKQIAELSTTKKPSNGNVEEDLRGRVTQYEQQNKSLSEKLSVFKDKQLRSEIHGKLASAGCNDPELLTDYFLAKKLVHYDDDDALIVENADNNLESLIRSELNRRPHLVKPSQSGGLGTKGPTYKPTVADPSRIKSMSDEEYAEFKQNLGIAKQPNRLFG